MLNKFKLSHIIALVVVLVIIIAIIVGGIYALKQNNAEQKWDRRPIVYVEDTIYYYNDYVKSLPDDVFLIGTIKEVIDQTELPNENFTSNSDLAPDGSSVYAIKNNPSVIYIERFDLDESGYMIYGSEANPAS